ncbi:hypothetical protein BO71DRAFT_209277 [Aspergillus ellipticus CBS 707.79]|uniref:Uncharacterized protein n=1 Tax=Aspergillus ellipticus CBS 707.79 TaxID=1448320 RepID=A0A319DCY6_9EURO|nr:hypothetical protein BO71DRAFT_209277 [Aspergillus ellipticus CBS 707.79]
MKTTSVLVFLWACGYSAAASNHVYFNPKQVLVGEELVVPNSPDQSITLTKLSPCVTLDYGADVAGFPTFEVQNLSGPAQIEVKYSEQLTGLEEPFSDGPSLFVSSLSNSFRVETFNVTQPGNISSGFLQGGQRWQSIRLLTSNTLTLRSASIKSTVGSVDIGNLPSTFQSSSTIYNKIWALGARAVSLACFDAGSQKSTWEVSRNGALVSNIKKVVIAVCMEEFRINKTCCHQAISFVDFILFQACIDGLWYFQDSSKGIGKPFNLSIPGN